jgi:hypothetical protein
MVRLGEVGRRQELVTRAAPRVAPGGCIANPDGVRGLFSVNPRLPMVRMRGSRSDAGP